jgi:hypothetical protein
MIKQPIKRNKHLQSLSREHHTGLLACWKIRQGLKKNIDPLRIKKYFLFFWEGHLKKHFEEEEVLLFNGRGGKITLALLQHDQIRKLVTELSNTIDELPAILQKLQSELQEHIRYEEREVFPYIEVSLTLNELERIGTLLIKDHIYSFCDDYPDEFWK